MWKFRSLRHALVFALLPLASIAQVSTGKPAFGSFGGGPFDTVNLGNLNAYFSIPIVDKAGRGLPFVYNLVYNSSVWSPVNTSGASVWTPAQSFGWSGQTAVVTGYMRYHEKTIIGRIRGVGGIWYSCPTELYSNFVYTDPFGVQHPFLGSTENTSTQPPECDPPPSQPSFTASASDGSSYSLSVTNYHSSSLTSKAGEQFTPPSLQLSGAGVATDSNGNQISTDGSGTFTDTLGTTVLTIGGGAPNPETFAYTNPQGSQSTYSMNYESYTVATDFQISGIAEYGPVSASLVSSVQLPDGTSYSFTYEETPAGANCTPLSGTFSGYCVTGRIASITLPTGGTITYSYSGGPSSTGIFPDGSTGGLTRNLSPGGTWSYSRSLNSGTAGPGSTWTTTSTDPNGNETVSQFTEDGTTDTPSTVATHNLYETERQVYQGSSTLLQTRIDCYNGNYAGCPSAAVSSPITQSDIYTELPNGSARLSEAQYNGAYSGSGLLSADYEYDYGVNQGSAPTTTRLRQVDITYASLNGIIGDPASIVVTGGGADQATYYSYDQSAVTATSGTPQHISISGSRGNLTTLKSYTQGSSYLSKAFVYYDTGEVYTATDVNGGTTTYSYGSGSCGNSFATSISEPLSLSRSITWSCSGAVATSFTDENGQTTTVSYNDPNFWRTTGSTDQENNQTAFSYSSNDTAVESALTFNGGNSVVDIRSTVDAFGRPILSQRLQGPGASNYDTREVDYDSTNELSRATMPFSASEGGTNSSAPAVNATYDALGRILTATDADGGTTTYTYNNNDVFITRSGSQSFKKQLEYDGLGRITSVCEISTTLPGAGTCGQSNAQTGYWAKYTYDALGHLLTVTQNAQAASNQQETRTYTYDKIGRITSESNPETGTTTYSYDAACGPYPAAPGDLTERVDNAGTATCYGYDALHRLTNGGSSGVCRRFNYDTSVTPPNGVTVANTKARLLEAETDNCSGATLTDEWFSYSPRGELADIYESTPHSGIYYHTTATYWPSGAVESLSGIPSVPTLYYGAGGNGLDGEGRYTEVTAGSAPDPVTGVSYSTSSTTNPLGAIASVTYGSSDSDSFSYDPNTGRQTEYVFTVSGATDTGTLNWSSNGTLASLDIADNIPGTSDSQSCSFSYDDLGRSSGVNCGSAWQQTFSYDAFGNIAKSGSLSFQPTYSTNNYFALSGVNVQYDADGNLLTGNLNSYTWDPNWGTMSSVSTGSTTVTVTYDALGRAVEQYNGSTYMQILYSPLGKTALVNGATLINAFAYLPGGGTAVYNSSGFAYYRHGDWLGSSRLASTQARGLYSSTAYAPFGEQYATSGTADPSFTGQNSDTVSSLYDFMFRRLSPSQGRWISPDPAGLDAVELSDPQTLNRYSYVSNEPLSFTDDLGLIMLVPIDCGADESCWCAVYGDFCGNDKGGGGGGGNGNSGGKVGGGGGAPSTGTKTLQLLKCASKTANQFSIAGFAGLTSEGGSFGARAGKAIGTAFLGNTFSGISDMFTHVGTGNFGAAYGDFALGGTAQGLPLGTSVSAKGIVGVTTDAAVGATLGAEMVEPVGWAKLAIDGLVFGGSVLSCLGN